MATATTGTPLTLSQSIVQTVLYYDLFNYPLKKEEVYLNLQTDHVTKEEVAQAIGRLTEANLLFQTGDLYSVRQDRALIERRIKGNKMAESFTGIAERRGRLIYSFPFVRSVMISGSLSKNYADEKTDVDFFIITAPNRLWIARMFLVLFKRIFLFNSHKYFCVNYFVDETHLEISEKNIFTATELATLIPLQGHELYLRFFKANRWVNGHLPHAAPKVVAHPVITGNSRLKRIVEKWFGSSLGSWLDTRFMHLTQNRWKRLYASKMKAGDFEIAFKSAGHVSKNHPSNYQRNVLERYREKLNSFNAGAQNRWPT